jgi:thymidylate synthase
MKDGFPLLTTKKMPFKTIVTELLWFLRGDTNIKYLVDNGCNIWNGDAYKNYLNVYSESIDGLESQEEFIDKIKTDDDFAKRYGELGPIYGKQWRKWNGIDDSEMRMTTYGIDQIQNLINDLKTNPDSRRLMVNAWNVGELDQMVLPPCHYGFQVYTRELSLDERAKLHPTTDMFYDINGTFSIQDSIEDSNLPTEDRVWLHSKFDEGGIPKRAISLMWNQRSVDTFLGLPFNIASYGLLLEIIANEVNMIPDELVGNLGDVHLYSNHIDAAKEQIGRDLTLEERFKLAGNQYPPGGLPNQAIYFMDKKGIPLGTRQPFHLPTLSYLDEYHYLNDTKLVGDISFSEKISKFRPDFFKVENYQSHPTIKAPLSN